MTPRATCLRWLGMTLLLAAATAIVFVLFPRLDLVVSRVFRSGSVAFPIEKTEAGRLARSTMIALTDGAMLTIVAAMLLAMLVPTLRVVRPRVLAFAASVYLLVPGLLVNGLLKRHWGRARPRHVAEFGGDATFTPPLQLADQCDRNCSFVSGEASALFTVAILVLLIVVPQLPARSRASVTAAILAVATFGSGLRVAFGAHFASDVVFAALISTMATLLLYCASGLHRLPGPFLPRSCGGAPKNDVGAKS